MDRRTIGLIWLGGLLLMLALYVIGPQDFLANLENFLAAAWMTLDALIVRLSIQALNAVRAAAIALYVVFVLLALLARRRGLRSGGALLTVSVLFLLLVNTDWYEPGTKWFTAALLAAVGAVVMTGRLLRPPPPPMPGSGQPWTRRPFYRNGSTG